MKVLVVDDDPLARLQLSSILDELNIPYDVYSDGDEAWRMVVGGEYYDVILSDWLMPKMSGIKLLKNIRSMAIDDRPQFILLTAMNDIGSLSEGLGAGADDFIRKPIVAEEIKARLLSAVRLRRLQINLKQHNIALEEALSQLERDVVSAAKILASLMPKHNVNDDIEFGFLFKPSRLLGGDLYGYRALTRTVTAFYLIDVCGHGVPAALFSAMVNYDLIRTHQGQDLLLSYRGDSVVINSVTSVVAELNRRYLADVDSDIYFTMIYGLINSETGLVHLCQAGHPSPIHYRQAVHTADSIGDGGFAVAMVAEAVYEERIVQLGTGDRLFLYSDGITDTENRSRVRYGDERLRSLIKRHGKRDITTIINKVHRSVVHWREHDHLDDDVTILAVQWNG